MQLLPKSSYPQTGDKVKPGEYACMNCDGVDPGKTTITKSVSRLPKCPKCNEPTYWYPITMD